MNAILLSLVLLSADPAATADLPPGMPSGTTVLNQVDASAVRGVGTPSPYARLTTFGFNPRPAYSCWLWIGGTRHYQPMRAK